MSPQSTVSRDESLHFSLPVDRTGLFISAKLHAGFIQITQSILTQTGMLAAILTIIADLAKITVIATKLNNPTVVLSDLQVLR